MLDNEKTLFRPGDDRVASLFLWHFVRGRHRSSALVIYDAVVGSPGIDFVSCPDSRSHRSFGERLAIQNAASGRLMISSSRFSMMPRSAARFGSMLAAKNVAVAILPR